MPQLIPQQGINFKVPNPVASQNLRIDAKESFIYAPQWTGWQFQGQHAYVNFGLTLPEVQAIRLSFVMCCMESGGRTNNPITMTVNGNYTLFTGFDPHRVTFETYTFYIPDHWLGTKNELTLSMDRGASTRATFWSLDIVGIRPRAMAATSVDLQTPSPVPTSLMSMTYHDGASYDPKLTAWGLVPNGWMRFNLYLDQPRMVTLTFNSACVPDSRGKPYSPYWVMINGKYVLIYQREPTNLDFLDFQWLVPPHWTVAGNNDIQIMTVRQSRTNLYFRSVGAAVQVLPAQTADISFVHERGKLLLSWPAMTYATTYDIELYRGTDRLDPVFVSPGFAGLGMALPGGAEPGTYAARVRPIATSVPGDWTDFSTLVLTRTIFFLSSAGQQSPTAARLALEDLGIVVFGNADNLHLEGIATAEQITEAGGSSYITSAYGRALSPQEIALLPPAQQRIAEAWNYYYSPAYQTVLADTTHQGASWGDSLINSPPSVQRVAPHMLRALLGPVEGAATESIEPLTGTKYTALEDRLLDHFGDDGVANRLCSAMAVLPAGMREKLLAPDLRAHVRALVEVDPKVAMRGKYALGIVFVQSTKDAGFVPRGWTVKAAAAAGADALQLTGGSDDPQPGDRFSIVQYVFTVTSWNPTTQTIHVRPETPAAISVGAVLAPIDTPRLGPTFSPADRLAAAQRVLDGLQRVQSNAPQFRPVNWVTAYDVPATATSFAITGGQTLPRTGDRFTLPGSAAAYQVTGFDIASSIIHVGAGVPATAKGSLLTYPDDLNLQIVSQIFDAGIDVAFDYDPNDEENDGCSYWVLPAVAKVTVGGKSFPATWAGVESLRLALQANTGAAGAGLVFVSNFPTNWFAFAMPQRGAITMSTRLRQFKATYEEDVKTALNARDQSFVRDWLNKGGLGTNVSIPASEPLAIDVLGVDRHWRVSTTVRDGATGGRMDKIYRILATGSPKLDTLTVFANSGFKIPR